MRVAFREMTVAMVLAAALAAPVQAATLQPAWAATPPAVDGDASATAWSAGTPVRIEAGADSATAYVLEDRTYVYVAVRATQRERVSAAALADDTPLERDDTVTLNLARSSETYSFRVNAFGTHEAHSSSSARFTPAWKSAGRIVKQGYEVTMRIPRALFERAGETWTLSLSRRIAATGNTVASSAMTLDSAAAGDAFHAARIVAGGQGKFSDAYRALWPSLRDPSLADRAPTLAAPDIPDAAGGVAVKHSEQGLTIVALDAHAASREDNAQSVGYSTADHRISATAARVETTDAGIKDLLQSVSLVYDNQAGLSAAGGVSLDQSVHGEENSQGTFTFTNLQYQSEKSSLDFFWSTVGDDYDPLDEFGTSAGTTRYSAHASRQLGNVSLEGSARSVRDDLGNVLNSGEQARISMPLGSDFNFSLNGASNFSDTVGAYNENGFAFDYSHGTANGGISYRTGKYGYGLLQDARISAAFTLPLAGSLTVEHRQTNFYSAALPEATQQFTSAGLTKRFGKAGSVSLSYEYLTGALPASLAESAAPAGKVAFSLDRYLKFGLLHLSLNRQTSVFAATPSFSIKLIPGASL